MITEQRRRVISKIAESLAYGHNNGNVTDLWSIITSEDIVVCHDDYEDAFDGMLFLDAGEFYLHVNTSRNSPGSKRERFTIGHEIGHYSINEHRLGLKYGTLKPHGSIKTLSGRNPIEEEADFFAGCLLMPETRFRGHSARKKGFSLESIIDLSQSFKASIVSTVLRFSEVGTHEIMAVFSRGNIVEWYAKSKDFPNWPNRFKVHENLPPTTVAGEFFKKNEIKYSGVEKVYPDDWFYPFPNDSRADRQMYEQCYYSDSYGYVISLIWFS